jgi:hypothetical protein
MINTVMMSSKKTAKPKMGMGIGRRDGDFDHIGTVMLLCSSQPITSSLSLAAPLALQPRS